MKTKTNLKPTKIDAHLKYRCPKCSMDHWISLKEARVEKFKIVCDCGLILEPKKIRKLKAIYASDATKQNSTSNNQQYSDIPSDIIDQCSKVLMSYGFTQQESKELLKREYIKNPTTDCKQLLKFTLESLGVNNNEQHSTNIV